MDFRGRAINLNSEGGLDLVFVIDASSSVRKLTDFKNGLDFAKELVKIIWKKRYDYFLGQSSFIPVQHVDNLKDKYIAK